MKSGFLSRSAEIATPLVSWILLTSPFWASFIVPNVVVYFIFIFDIYFLYKASALGINSVRSYIKIKASTKTNWLEKMHSEKLDYSNLKHIVFIPTYKEPIEILNRTLTFLAEQEFPAKQIIVVLAGETREDSFEEKANALKAEFQKFFYEIIITAHILKDGEVAGKSSNQSYAAQIVKNYVETHSIDKNYLTTTSCDADVSIHLKYFSNLSYLFLKNPHRYTRFWQGALVFYNNIWRVPFFVRIVHTIYSIIDVAELMRAKTNFIYSSYSTSWVLLEKTGFWDPDVISEDWHLFFKAFFATKGEIEIEAIFLPLYGDAVESQSYWGSFAAQYQQNRRWAWGVVDIGYAINQFIIHRKVISIPNFALRFAKALEQHLLWPVNWWIITLGATLPPLLNKQFQLTTQGYYLPKLSGLILTCSTFFLIFILVIDWLLKPPRPESVKRPFFIFNILQYLLLPVVGFLFGALPGMDAHTRVLLGKRLDYKVTEKISNNK